MGAVMIARCSNPSCSSRRRGSHLREEIGCFKGNGSIIAHGWDKMEIAADLMKLVMQALKEGSMKHTLLLVLLLTATLALSQTQTVYNSIPKPLPANVASEGPEAYAFSELGDGLALTANTGTLGQVTVIMSSWACQSGNWYSGNCVTTPGATFSQQSI
jgi:uncharacterized membrane protein